MTIAMDSLNVDQVIEKIEALKVNALSRKDILWKLTDLLHCLEYFWCDYRYNRKLGEDAVEVEASKDACREIIGLMRYYKRLLSSV